MNKGIEIKLREDDHCGGFGNGLTLCGSRTTRELENVSENEYKTRKGHSLKLNQRNVGDCVELSTTFTNSSSEPAVLELLSSFALRGIKCDKVHRFQSFWSAEGRLKTEKITDLHLERSWSGYGIRAEKFGCLGSMPVRKYFPFIALENSETGEFVAVQLYLASSWQIEILNDGEGEFAIVGGIADRDFGHWSKIIKPQESFTTPRAMVATGISLSEVCDKLVKAQSPDISEVDEDMGIMFNEFCTTWGNPTLENIKKIADSIKGKGIKYLVMDCGWYADENGWELTIGDWVANRDMFPNGLKEVADYIKQSGMIPGIWFEMEVVGRSAKAFHNTEHLLKKDGVVITSGNRRFWDFTDPWVVEYMSEKLIKTIKECGFGYLKVDYNETIGIGCDGAESLGEGLRQRVEASQAFFKKIRAEIPELVIENCSSGGHRLEPSMMELVSQASFSDAHETKAIPIIAANLHYLIKPSQAQIWAVLRKQDDENRLNYSLVNTFLGRMCLSGDIYDLNQRQWEIVDDAIKFYKKIADIIKFGVTTKYENHVESYNKPCGEQIVVREYEDKVLVVAHRFENFKDVSLDFTGDYTLIDEFGKLDSDFSAKAFLFQKEKNL